MPPLPIIPEPVTICTGGPFHVTFLVTGNITNWDITHVLRFGRWIPMSVDHFVFIGIPIILFLTLATLTAFNLTPVGRGINRLMDRWCDHVARVEGGLDK